MNIKEWYKSLNNIYKSLIFVICILFFLLLILFSLIFSLNNHSKLKLYTYEQASPKAHALIALNSMAKKACVKEDGYAFFKFTKESLEDFERVYKENGTAALKLRINTSPTTRQCLLLDGENDLPFEFGYLYENDFSEKGKFLKKVYPNVKRIVVQADQRKDLSVYDLSLSLQKSEKTGEIIPKGFFIRASVRTYISKAALLPSPVGFDLSGEIPFYGFPYNGGKIDFTNSSFDFTGAAMVFPTRNSSSASMPLYKVKLSREQELLSTLEKGMYAECNFGGERISIKNTKAAEEILIPSAALKAPFSRMEISTNSSIIKSLTLNYVENTEANKGYVLSPVKTDPGLILNYKMDNWRCDDYELYEWDRYPKILFFDTKTLDIQSKFFTRLAFFVEKAGYKGRILSDEELEGKHGYNAHDYKAEDLARFFNTALDKNVKLNYYEMLLKEILIYNGLFTANGKYVKANDGGLVSISRETKEWSRQNLFSHEGWHMQFFRDEEFRNYVTAVFHTCDQNTKDFLIDYFRSQPSLGYDTNDDYLMYNEFMAYIMEQRTSVVAENFVKKANWESVIKFTPELAAYIRNTEGRGFEDISNALNSFVFDKYGIIAGNICLVSRN
jgi:hypothetical protein